MATEKILNTKIKLRAASKADWDNDKVAKQGANLVLEKGEAGVYMVPADTSAGTEAATMLKIGDGNNTAFKDLPWVSALAADVYPWAKEPGLPVISPTSTSIGDGNVVTDISWNASANEGKGELQYRKEIYALTSHQSIKKLNTKNTNSLTVPDTPEEIAGSGTINLHKVSKTGSYNDLRDKPTIGNGALTIYQNGETKTTFYANQSGVGAADLTDTKYQLANSGTTLKLQSKTNGNFADSSEVNLATILANTFINTSGDTMTGPLYLPAEDPSEDYEATTKTYVDNLVASAVSAAVQFLGTFGSDATLAGFKFDSNGDFARCSDTYESQWYGTIHAGDIAVVTDKTKIASTGAYKIVHGETYTMNSATADGYVAKGQGNANKVWKTDASGNPAWREDTNTAHSHAAGVGLVVTGSGGASGTTTYKAKLKSETLQTPEATLTTGSLLEPVVLDKNGVLAAYIPNRKIKLAYGAIGNFYVVDKNASETLEVFIPYVNSVVWDGKRVTISFKDIVNKDLDTNTAWNADDNHVPTTLAVKNELDSHAGIDKVGTVTSVGAGTGLTITGTNTVNPKVEFDDSVIFVLNGGTATTVI